METITTNETIRDLFIQVYNKDRKAVLMASGIQEIMYDTKKQGLIYTDKLGNQNFIYYVRDIQELEYFKSPKSKAFRVIVD